MFEVETNSVIQSKIRVLQMVAGGLIVGVATFTAIAMAVGGQNAAGQSSIDVLRYVAGATLFGGMVGAFAFNAKLRRPLSNAPQAITADINDQQVQEQRFGRFFAYSIISLALLEGPALFGAVIVLLSGNAMDLLLVAIPVAGMILMFPTRGKWERFSQSRGSGELEPFNRS